MAIKSYEVEVTIKSTSPPEDIRSPVKLTFTINADNGAAAVTEALKAAQVVLAMPPDTL